MFPQYDIKVDTNAPFTDKKKSGKRVFLFDYVTKQYVFKDGKPVEATYEQAIQQWLARLLTTEMNKYEIYKDSGFGLSILQFIGRRDLPSGVIYSELKRQIEEKAINHPEIVSIGNFSTEREGGKITIAFHVVTKQGGLVDFSINLVE